jgi:hypothetical protein
MKSISKISEEFNTLLPSRRCTKCGKVKPLTEGFFLIYDKKWFSHTCKVCNQKIKNKLAIKQRIKPIPPENYIPRENDGTVFRVCTKCGKKLLETIDNFGWRAREKQFRSNCRDCGAIGVKLYTKNNLRKRKKYENKYRIENKNALIIKRYWPAEYKRYVHKLTIEESPIKDDLGYLLVKCTYCGKYFPPHMEAVRKRIDSLVGKGTGECRLYCSKGCQDACPIFKQVLYSKDEKQYNKASSREVDPLIRQMCLARDNYTCQKCEKTIEEIELHAHHYEGVTQQPMLANDVDNTITLCKPCHIWVHQQEGCTNYDMQCKK